MTCPLCRCDCPVGVELPWIWDGVCYWVCPDCKHRWHRFAPEQTDYRKAVEQAWAIEDAASELPPEVGQHD